MRGRPPPGGPASPLPARESSWTKDAPQKPKITLRDWPPKPWIVGFHRRRPTLRYFEAAFRRLPFEALHRLPGVERQMQRQYHIRALEKRAERTPLARRRLQAEHIETRSGDPAVPDRRRRCPRPGCPDRRPAPSPENRRRTSAPCFLRSCRSRQARPSCRRYRRPAIAVPAEPGPLHAWRGQAVAVFSPARSSARTRLRRRFPRHIPAR